MNDIFKFRVVFLCMLVAACNLENSDINLSDKQIIVLEEIEKNILYGMDRDRVQIILKNKIIKFSETIPYIFSGKYIDSKYQGVNAIFIEVIPDDRTGCWNGVLVVIRFDANVRVDRIIEEEANFCG